MLRLQHYIKLSVENECKDLEMRMERDGEFDLAKFMQRVQNDVILCCTVGTGFSGDTIDYEA